MKNEKLYSKSSELKLVSLQETIYSGEIEAAINEHNQASTAYQDIVGNKLYEMLNGVNLVSLGKERNV